MYSFLRQDDVYSFVLVCAVNACKHLRDEVYAVIGGGGGELGSAGLRSGRWALCAHLLARCPFRCRRDGDRCASCLATVLEHESRLEGAGG
jgi:hypothetical protein